MMTKDYRVTVTETAVPKMYTLTLVASLSSGGGVSGSGSKQAGSSVNIQASANSNYSFDGWYIGTSKISSSTSYIYMMQNANTTITSKLYKQVKKVTIILQTRKSGSYGPNIVMRVVGGGEKAIGTTCNIYWRQ